MPRLVAQEEIPDDMRIESQSKDFLLLLKKTPFTIEEVQKLFDDGLKCCGVSPNGVGVAILLQKV